MIRTNDKSILLHRTHAGLARRTSLAGMAGAVLALAGCMTELDPGAPAGEREVVEHTAEIVGELETRDGAKLTFSIEHERADRSGAPVVAITEVAPIGAPAYLDQLRARGATSLEAFLALAPAGTEAPAELRAAHPREAAALGRSAELRALPSGAAASLTTFDSATCDSYAAFTGSVSSWLSELTGASSDSHSLTFGGGGNVGAAMCNYDSDRVDYKYAQFCHEVTVQGSPMGLLYCDAETIVPDGHRVNKSWLNATTDRVARAQKLENYTLVVTSYLAIGELPPVP